MQIFSDKELSQKFELSNARSNIDFVESHAKLFPGIGAEWIEVAGVYAMFDGVGFPTTQTFGLGMFGEITETEMDPLESFFTQRGSDIFHEVSPLADSGLLPILNDRGYRPIEFSNALYTSLESADLKKAPRNPKITTRIMSNDEVDLFSETSTKGWMDEMPEFAEQLLQFSKIGAKANNAIPFFAELAEKPIATGTLFIYDDVAILAGASTVPEFRLQGAQSALLEARLRFALEKGCSIAIMDAMPGSQSQKNAEKNGFKIAYTRTKWRKSQF